MSTPSLENKTIRPGSLLGYSYYYSKNKTAAKPVKKTAKGGNKNSKTTKPPQRHYKAKLLALLLLAVGAGLLIHSFGHTNVAKVTKPAKTVTIHVAKKTVPPTPTPAPVTTPAAAPVADTPCTGNTLNELVLVSISQRHLWACQQGNEVYDSAVITGISYLAADLTPTGTYHVYAKETDRHLIGSDSTGSWDDFVNYWMPFLHNQYGNYGFHDATWRDPSAFGNISPDSADASHGCVEMPLATAKWLYDWSYIGTTVTIES
jgi:lipoprotein-anchoring transpeptidase ErfK/SrfK